MLFSLAQTPLQSATTSQNPKILQVFTGLILVNCDPAKISMAHHINNFRDAILGQIELWQMEANVKVIRLFEEQEELIMRESQSTAECLQVTKDIANAQVQLDELRVVLEKSRQADCFLEDHWCAVCFWAIAALALLNIEPLGSLIGQRTKN
jgi:hypothetical protein